METSLLDGVYCPSITPLDEAGNIDFAGWEAHLNRVIDAGVSGVLLFGSIGEFYAFDVATKAQAIERMAAHVAGRCQLLVGVSSTSQREALSLVDTANKTAADAVVCLPPYYFSPSDGACFDFYGAIAQASDAPLVLYNFPATTGKDLSGEFVADLSSRIPSIAGVKDTVDSASHTRQMIEATRALRPGFSVLSGFDEYYVTNRLAGGNGVLSGLTNVVPQVFASMDAAWNSKDYAAMLKDAARISQLMAIYGCADSFIAAIKGAVCLMGEKIATHIANPALQLTPAQLDRIAHILKK